MIGALAGPDRPPLIWSVDAMLGIGIKPAVGAVSLSW